MSGAVATLHRDAQHGGPRTSQAYTSNWRPANDDDSSQRSVDLLHRDDSLVGDHPDVQPPHCALRTCSSALAELLRGTPPDPLVRDLRPVLARQSGDQIWQPKWQQICIPLFARSIGKQSQSAGRSARLSIWPRAPCASVIRAYGRPRPAGGWRRCCATTRRGPG